MIAQPLEGPAQNPRGGAQRWRRLKGFKSQTHRPGALEGRPGADQTPEVMGPSHSFQPECSAATPNVMLRYLTCSKPPARIIAAKRS